MKEINSIIKQIQGTGLEITREGDIQDFLRINIKKGSGKTTLAQPHLITQILKDLHMDTDEVKIKRMPSRVYKILLRGDDKKDFDKSFQYRSIIGKLNHLEKGSRSDILYITHQCARFTYSQRHHTEKQCGG